MKLKIDNRKKMGKYTNTWKLNNTLLNEYWVKGKIQRKLELILRQTKMKHNKPKLKDTTKAILRGKFMAINAYDIKEERYQINRLTLHLKKLENEEQTKPKISRRKKSMKIIAKINKIGKEN